MLWSRWPRPVLRLTRDRIIVVPTRAAASLLLRTIEDAVLDASTRALVLPDLVTPRARHSTG